MLLKCLPAKHQSNTPARDIQCISNGTQHHRDAKIMESIASIWLKHSMRACKQKISPNASLASLQRSSVVPRSMGTRNEAFVVRKPTSAQRPTWKSWKTNQGSENWGCPCGWPKVCFRTNFWLSAGPRLLYRYVVCAAQTPSNNLKIIRLCIFTIVFSIIVVARNEFQVHKQFETPARKTC